MKVMFGHENECQDHCAHESLRDPRYLERNFPFLLWNSLLQFVLEGPQESMSPTSECGSGPVLACKFTLTSGHHFLVQRLQEWLPNEPAMCSGFHYMVLELLVTTEVEYFHGKKCDLFKELFPPCLLSPPYFHSGEWKAAFPSIQIKLVFIVLISIGLVARSNYNKWELKRFPTGRFNSQMACLRMSYKGEAPIRLERKLCLSSSSSAWRQQRWNLANISVFWRFVIWPPVQCLQIC